MKLPYAFAALLALAACGGTVVTGPGGQGGTGGGGGSAGQGGSGGDPCTCGASCTVCYGGPDGPCAQGVCYESGECLEEGIVPPNCGPCPNQLPAQGAPCAGAAACEYDGGPIVPCRQRAYCDGGAWQLLIPNCVPEFIEPPGCPAAEPSPGAACDVMVDPYLCLWDTTFCGCTDCLGGGPCGGTAEWVCASPEPGCPPEAPLLGKPCSSEGQACDYGSCSLGSIYAGRTCQGGIWVESTAPCPL